MGSGGDRREQERAEIVGQLWGSLGDVHPLRDIGRGGGLFEAARSLRLLSVHRMRLALGPVAGDARVRVCRVEAVAGPDGRERYRIGLEFVELPPPLLEQIDRLVAADAAGSTGSAVRTMAQAFEERRRTPRVTVLGRGRCEMTIWSTVRLVDISLSGVLLASGQPIGAPERAELRTAFGGDAFTSVVEVRRVQSEAPDGEAGSVRLGVRFVDPDEDSRRALRQFLRRAIL